MRVGCTHDPSAVRCVGIHPRRNRCFQSSVLKVASIPTRGRSLAASARWNGLRSACAWRSTPPAPSRRQRWSADRWARHASHAAVRGSMTDGACHNDRGPTTTAFPRGTDTLAPAACHGQGDLGRGDLLVTTLQSHVARCSVTSFIWQTMPRPTPWGCPAHLPPARRPAASRWNRALGAGRHATGPTPGHRWQRRRSARRG